MITYAQYLQPGGSISPTSNRKKLKDLALAVSRLQDETAQRELISRIDGIRRQENPEDLKELEELQQEALRQDKDAVEALGVLQQVAQAIEKQSQTQSAKCGAKLKKAETGLQIPAKRVKRSKGGKCPCTMHRVGGKIIEIDTCTGKIVK